MVFKIDITYLFMLVYVLSDLHISSKDEIPLWIVQKVKKADLFLINGDITSQEVLNELSSYSKCLVVKGNCDSLHLPKTNVFEIEGIKCGQVHGDTVSPRGDWDQLYNIAESLEVNILFSGHTHNYSVYEYKNKLFINPGSATGTSSIFCDRKVGTIAEIIFSDFNINVLIISDKETFIDLIFDKKRFI